MTLKQEFTKYERARILGARALQISMDAPLLMKVEKEKLESVNYDPLRLAELELDSGVLPISIDRPMPEKNKEKLQELTAEEIEKLKKEAEQAAEKEASEDEDSEEGEEVKKETVVAPDVDLKPEEELDEELEETGSSGVGEEESYSDD